MFSRNKDKETEKQAPPAMPQAAAPQVPAQQGKRAGVRTAPSIFSNDLVVHGNITASGDIQIDGTVEGDIRSQSLTIGEKASITGELVAEDIVIRGRVTGMIRGRRVQLASTCHVEGDILHEALAVETGAYFEGNCRHSDDPIGQVARPAPKPVSATPQPQPRPVAPRPEIPAGEGPVVLKDGGVVVRRPAAQ